MYCIDSWVYFYIKEREVIYNTFILTYCNYFSLAWHLFDTSLSKKIEKAQEKALWILLINKTSSYAVLMEKKQFHSTTYNKNYAIACEIVESLNDLNPRFMKVMFHYYNIIKRLLNSARFISFH